MNHFKRTNKKLEKLRGIFFQLGLVIACGLSLLAFEWRSPVNYYAFDDDDGFDTTFVITDLPPITFQTPPEKPKVKIIPQVDDNHLIEIVDNNTDIELTPDVDVLPEFIPDYSEPMTKEPVDHTPFTIVEEMPDFIGGNKARVKYLRDNLNYPKMDRMTGIEGTVHLQFVVNKKGEIRNIKVVRGVSELIDKEAIRVLKAMPNWKPGKQRGKPVKVMLNMPIKFELR